jgi:quercetin dioxygenase-like cupin family protein
MAERYVWDEIGERTIIKGFHGKFVHSERMTFVMWRFDEGTILPRHRHPHEQVAIVLEGELEIAVDGVTHLCTGGSVLVIPPDAWHEGRFLTETRVLDVFAPVREDYREGAATTILNASADDQQRS